MIQVENYLKTRRIRVWRTISSLLLIDFNMYLKWKENLPSFTELRRATHNGHSYSFIYFHVWIFIMLTLIYFITYPWCIAVWILFRVYYCLSSFIHSIYLHLGKIQKSRKMVEECVRKSRNFFKNPDLIITHFA